MSLSRITITFEQFINDNGAIYTLVNGAGKAQVIQYRFGGEWNTPYFMLSLTAKTSWDYSDLLAVQALVRDARKIYDLIEIDMKADGTKFAPVNDPLHYLANKEDENGS